MRYWFYSWLRSLIDDALSKGARHIIECLGEPVVKDSTTIQWLKIEQGQFVEYDDEGGVYTYVDTRKESNQKSYYSSSDYNGYNYVTMSRYNNWEYGPNPNVLQALMYRTVTREDRFRPELTLNFDQEILSALSHEELDISYEEYTFQLFQAITLTSYSGV